MAVTIELIWQDFLKIMHEEAGSRVVETWFKAVKFVRWDVLERTVYLEAPNLFVKQWISSHYLELCQKHLSRLLSEEKVSVVFVDSTVSTPAIPPIPASSGPIVLMQLGENAHKGGVELYQAARPITSSENRVKAVTARKKADGFNGALMEQYRFDTFVVGPSNALAFSAAQATVESRGKLYNPLFIYGGSGLGKTHLLHAIGNAVREQSRHRIVLYQSADRFVHDFVLAIRQNKVHEFEARYKDIDMLLVDDVQFISKKEQTQEAFFRIFNAMHQTGRQIIFTSDSMPCDIVGLAERVRSRLAGGLVADIQMPTLETKVAILLKKAEANNYVLEDEIAYCIASCECSSVRELEGMLIRVMAYASLTKQPLTEGVVRKVLTHTSEVKKEGAGLPSIARFVGKYFNYTVQELRSSKRNKDLSQARHVAMYLMKRLTDASLREIGIFFERKDHTTVLSALEKIEKHQRRDRLFASELRKIENDLRSGNL
ncbi:TPA: chromosomal replication initiator protein DnaA [Candidatus Dependentiae bacterium]|nr:MAG: Chromosomal replication initiator protein DnaA [candidate division TM6 bacterium GW2011_GWF2_43_87]HBL98768.1 chromosomal replication initiator protein DnaA [Candidatus Dependentiae bacterium]